MAKKPIVGIHTQVWDTGKYAIIYRNLQGYKYYDNPSLSSFKRVQRAQLKLTQREEVES